MSAAFTGRLRSARGAAHAFDGLVQSGRLKIDLGQFVGVFILADVHRRTPG